MIQLSKILDFSLSRIDPSSWSIGLCSEQDEFQSIELPLMKFQDGSCKSYNEETAPK